MGPGGTVGEGVGVTGVGAGTDGSADGTVLATATGDPDAATGNWRPPRAATKVIAITAQATVNAADPNTAGVSVRRPGGGLETSTPLLCDVGWWRTLVPFHGGRADTPDARLRRILVGVLPMSELRPIEAPDRLMALPLPIEPTLLPDPSHLAPHRIKRCTFRRLIRVDPRGERRYDVECLFPDRKLAIPLGDLDAATPICNACTAAHIFRPDED